MTKTPSLVPTKPNQIQRRRLLTDFLRARRARISPESVGLPNGQRRRTPGLRREEVALLAGVSVSWYTWFEQGREIQVSSAVLDSLVRVLQLDGYEREHLYVLARDSVNPLPWLCHEIDSGTQLMLDMLDPAPAYVISPCCTVVAWNQAAQLVFGDWQAKSMRERNLLWMTFSQPGARLFFADWVGETQRVLAFFRANSTKYIGHPILQELINDLMAISPEFCQLWAQHDVGGITIERKELRHWDLGSLVFHPKVLQIHNSDQQQLVVYLPLDEAQTREKLEQALTTTI
ncbi:helix-turn-helix transcriptional regulator [Herpetosiphon sp.]|nr:helix-turn-helix transcriptional regulator [Herpetosiphon sp.]